ncbi:hypothetical protein CONLIGDRAFT_636976 [Coniochaeta ligniaria NRRL 30616]|uniref:Uncharacterized protein n=1 Tax=Coniochaeta ligniaria NRRL 30616 TaxID=1408157 RepID=A0A1J7IT44_9PEZI|nr:hypothetical protein CONLIGDRAFT_636976 [Coniochaeta ligniaria NRRL 30616]
MRELGLSLRTLEHDVVKLIASSDAVGKGEDKDILSVALLEGTHSLIEAVVHDLGRKTKAFEGDIQRRREEAQRWPSVLP